MKRKQSRAADQPVRVAGYVRVSTARQVVEGDSLVAQENAIRAYVEGRKLSDGWSVASVEMYVDQGKSAKDQNRPKLQQLRQDVAAGKIDAIVCCKLDRITRSILDFADLWQFFEQHGVELISLKEKVDTSSAMGRAMLMIIMVFAELERNMTGERTIMTMADRVSRGLWNGGTIYGYVSDPNEKGKLLVDPEWAEIIRTHFFGTFEQLGSARKLQVYLKERGIVVPQRKTRGGKQKGGKPFALQQIINVLRCRRYVGTAYWGDYSKEDAHEPIISKEQFERVQGLLGESARLRANHRYQRDRQYILKGLVRCGHCGSAMTPQSANGNGGRYHFYVCTKKIHYGPEACSAIAIPAPGIEEAMLKRVRAIELSTTDRERIIEEAKRCLGEDGLRVESELTAARSRLTAVQREINNLMAVLKSMGEQGLATVRDEMEKLSGEKAQLQTRIEELAERSRPAEALSDAGKKFVESWGTIGELLDGATPADQRQILRQYINRVELRSEGKREKVGTYRLWLFPETTANGNAGGKSLTDSPRRFAACSEKLPEKDSNLQPAG